MRIHLIAIGGSIMHNLAICLQKAGHNVSGSDDEIYEPAYTRLSQYGLLPRQLNWHPESLTADIDLIILGMHAKADNPELVRAKELGLKVVSFPEYVGLHSAEKERVVVCGSHGKTTTTSMILHVLQYGNYQFDYLVGAQLKGFETMVSLTDAPLIVVEGDEYLSSAVDRVPKIWYYHPHISIITGIAWDHMNVFPTLESYHDAFRGYLSRLPSGAMVYFAGDDPVLMELISEFTDLRSMAYHEFNHDIVDGICRIKLGAEVIPLKIFGSHNMANLQAAYLVLRDLGVSDPLFLEAISSFEGAAKRLQLRRSAESHLIYQDFAHAPSKVKATIKAMKDQYPHRKLTACIELHTFSSLNKKFLPQYLDTTNDADVAIVFYSEHTLKMKGMPPISAEEIREAFGRKDILIMAEKAELKSYLENQSWQDHNLLLMSSGTFDGLDVEMLKTN